MNDVGLSILIHTQKKEKENGSPIWQLKCPMMYIRKYTCHFV